MIRLGDPQPFAQGDFVIADLPQTCQIGIGQFGTIIVARDRDAPIVPLPRRQQDRQSLGRIWGIVAVVAAVQFVAGTEHGEVEAGHPARAEDDLLLPALVQLMAARTWTEIQHIQVSVGTFVTENMPSYPAADARGQMFLPLGG